MRCRATSRELARSFVTATYASWAPARVMTASGVVRPVAGDAELDAAARP